MASVTGKRHVLCLKQGRLEQYEKTAVQATNKATLRYAIEVSKQILGR